MLRAALKSGGIAVCKIVFSFSQYNHFRKNREGDNKNIIKEIFSERQLVFKKRPFVFRKINLMVT